MSCTWESYTGQAYTKGYSHNWASGEIVKLSQDRSEYHELLINMVRIDAKSKYRILDFGGSLGFAYYALKKTYPNIEFKYTVVEIPEICKEGNHHCPEVNFVSIDDIGKVESVDLVYARGALQYTKNWRESVKQLALKNACSIVLELTSIGPRTFQVLQRFRHGKATYWFISHEDLQSTFSGLGYECVSSLPAPPAQSTIPLTASSRWHSNVNQSDRNCQFKNLVFKRRIVE